MYKYNNTHANDKLNIPSFSSFPHVHMYTMYFQNPEDADPTKDYYQTSVTSTIVTMDDLWNQLNYTASMVRGMCVYLSVCL